MKDKKWRRLGAALLSLLFLAAGCGKRGADSSGTTGSGTTSAGGSNTAAADTMDVDFSSRDMDVGYNEAESTSITFGSGGIVITGGGASAADSTVTITGAGTYILSGTLDNGRILVNAGKEDKIQLVLDGVSVHCKDNAPLFIQQADKVFLTLAQGSENSFSDEGAYTLGEEDANVDAPLFSRADLTINGEGNLTVTATDKHGIVSKDDLVITGGTITVTAGKDGLCGKDCVKIADGTFVIRAGSDGIQSNNDEEDGKGTVYIRGGSFDIVAATDGIQAETALRIDGGAFTIQTGGGSANASTGQSGGFDNPWGQWGTGDSSADTASAKGLKAGSELMIQAGEFQVDSSDDSIHCNGNIILLDGHFDLSSGDDGIHADGNVAISGGTIAINKSYEGIEGASIDITGGTIRVTASDDGLNTAGGNDGSSLNGRPGQNNFRPAEGGDSSYYLRITGGELTVNASGDGLDSNGALYIEGGTILVSGPTNSGNGALDYDGTGTVSGGIVVAAGASGMAQGFTSASTQCSILYTFSSTVGGGTAFTLSDSADNVLVTFAPEKSYQSVVVSVPEMVLGETYTLTAGSQTASVTLTSVATSGGAGGMGGDPGGGMGGGMGGDPGGGMGPGRR